MRTNQPFIGSVAQRVVAGLLCVLVIVVLPSAMFTTLGPRDRVQWLGMTVEPLLPEMRAALDFALDLGGVMVERCEGQAAAAGVAIGDVLIRINGEPVTDVTGAITLIRKATASKQPVQLDLVRRGVQFPVFIDPAARPAQAVAAQTVPAQTAPATVIDQRWFGIELDPFTAQNAKAAGLPADVTGLAVDGVTVGSRAEQMGLASGDVIMSVNLQRTEVAADLWNALGAVKPGDPVQFAVWRKGQLVYLTLPAGSMTQVALGVPAPAAGVSPLVCPYCRTRIARRWGGPGFCLACPSCGATMVQGDVAR